MIEAIFYNARGEVLHHAWFDSWDAVWNGKPEGTCRIDTAL